MELSMNLEGLVNIRKALTTLNPKHVREDSERPLRVAINADPESYRQIEHFLLRDLSPARRSDSVASLVRNTGTSPVMAPDLEIYDAASIAPAGAHIFEPERRHQFVERVLSKHADLGIPLSKRFPPFRRPYIERSIAKTARENTLFSIATALPDVIPSFIELPWAIAEFASDSAFLTMNQVRMAFQIAAASDREVGYLEQKAEIGAVIGSAFGWRALARQLVGKIPFGGGLIAKAAVAYAGTKVLGLSLERFYSIGFTYTREERDRLYADAFRQGKRVAGKILNYVRPDLAAKYTGRVQPPVELPSAGKART
jgi:hypothetical protein